MFLSILLLTLGFIGVVFFLKKRANKDFDKTNYTIGTIATIVAKKNGFLIKYNYEVNNHTYAGSIRQHKTQLTLGTKYLVSFNPNKPETSSLLYKEGVKNNVTKAPVMGWPTLPSLD